MISNALAGEAVGRNMGLTPEEIKAGIEQLPSMPGRGNIIDTDHIVILDDCYNANPVSMKAAMDVLDIAIGRKTAILGDMGELGDDAPKMHYDVGAYAGDKKIDLVCAIGTLGKEIAAGASKHGVPDVKWFETKEDFLQILNDVIKPGDNVLVKSSHGMHLEEIVEALQQL